MLVRGAYRVLGFSGIHEGVFIELVCFLARARVHV